MISYWLFFLDNIIYLYEIINPQLMLSINDTKEIDSILTLQSNGRTLELKDWARLEIDSNQIKKKSIWTWIN